MPVASGQACFFGPERIDMKRHDFAGAAAQVLDLIAEFTQGDPDVDQSAIAAGRAKAVSMLERAATLEVLSTASVVRVRVINESGHKLPTGHIEGRRVWVNVRFLNKRGEVVREHGRYDESSATLDSGSTTVFEMHVGLSASAAGATGLPPGPTGHMALADTIEKDNRIPPRGWSNAAYAAGGAPAVGAVYADGQHWADVDFAIPPGAVRADARLYYQNTPREYIDHLRDANTTDHWGQTLHSLWTATGRGAPILMASSSVGLTRPRIQPATTAASLPEALARMLGDFGSRVPRGSASDRDGDGVVTMADLFRFLAEQEGDGAR